MSDLFCTFRNELQACFDKIRMYEVEGTVSTNGWKFVAIDDTFENQWITITATVEVLFEASGFFNVMYQSGEDTFRYELEQRFVVNTFSTVEIENNRWKASFEITQAFKEV